MKWQQRESVWIGVAIGNINRGSSIYSQIRWLAGNKIFGRSWDSIRSKIRRMRASHKEVQELLENPPLKSVDCGRCGGQGIINCRGMIVSDQCPNCRGSGKINVKDYILLEKLIRKAIHL